MDAYLTVVGGELVTNLYPLPRVNDKFALQEVGHHEAAQCTVKQEIVHVTTGTLLMPSLGWDVKTIPQQTQTPDVCYIDYPIPPPIHACVEIGILMDKLLIEKPEFLRCGDCRGRQLSSAEYNELILDHEDLSDIRVFGDYLKRIHNRKYELELNGFEDNLDILPSEWYTSPHY